MNAALQFSIIFGICLFSEWISSLLPVPFPGSVIAMLVVFLLLSIKLLKVESIETPTKLLTGNMGIIFLPASVGIIEYFHLVKGIVLQFAIICVIATVVTFAMTAMTVRVTCHLMNKNKGA